MKDDIIKWLDGKRSHKRPSKETLNHPGLITLASGVDPFKNTYKAYKIAYMSLGIDIINFMPGENAPVPLSPGETKLTHDGRVQEAYYGVYNTSSIVLSNLLCLTYIFNS